MRYEIKHTGTVEANEIWRTKTIRFFETVGKILDKILNPLNKKLIIFSSTVFAIMVLSVIADVFGRLIFNLSIPGIIEIQEIGLPLAIFFIIGAGECKKVNIRIDLFYARFPQGMRNTLDNIFYFCTIILFIIITYQTFIQSFHRLLLRTDIMKLPVYIFMILAALGMFILIIALIRNFSESIVETIKNRNTPWLLLTLLAGLGLIMLQYFLDSYSIAMNPLALGGLTVLFLFILMQLGMPIGFAMVMAAYVGLLFAKQNSAQVLSLMGTSPYFSVGNYTFAVLPMFMLMGKFTFESGISRDLFDTANKWLGRFPGGLAISSVVGCAGFAAVCGDSMATAATMSAVALPEMQKNKYDPSIAAGTLAAGGTLGILIPPSIGFIIYAIVTEQSVGRLFTAGIIPGILLTFLFCAYIYFYAKRHPDKLPRGQSYSFKEKIHSLKGIISMVLLFVLVLGGILGGFFSPNEGGAMGILGALLIALARRRFTMEGFLKAFQESLVLGAMMFTIFIGVGLLGYFLSATQLPMRLADFITGFDMNKYTIILAVGILYIVLGALMNVVPMIMLTLPAIFPTILAMGIDPIWFGVFIVILMEMGQITPPVGINVFTISTMSGVPLGTIFRGIVPFFLCMLLLIVLLVIFPQLALFLPEVLF